jgi:hypothetical protein
MTTVTRTEPRDSERLRNQAAAADQGPTDQQRDEFEGAFSRLWSNVQDPQNPTDVSFPFLRRMRRHHDVAFGLHLTRTPLIKSSFFFEADDAKVAAFADNIVRPIYGSSILTITRILDYGFSPAVQNREVVNPSWTYMVDGEMKKVWDSTAVGALVPKPLVPLRPESCRLAYDGKGKWNGILWDEGYSGRGGFYLDGVVKPQVDLAHSVWASHDSELEDGSPYGHARLAYCAPIFHLYRWLWTLLGRAFENNADPGPTVGFPEDPPGPLASGEVSNKETALMIGRRKRSGSTIAMPSTPYSNYANDRTTSQRQWLIEYIKNETDFDSMQGFLGYLDAMIYRALLIPEQSAIEGSGSSSSRNVVTNLSSQRDTSQIVLMQQIMDNVIMKQIVEPAMAINMPWYSGRLEMKVFGFGQQDTDIVRQVLQLAGQQDLKQFGIDLRRLVDSQGFPMLGDTEFAKEIKRREEQAQQISDGGQPPAVEPTQGRRALVTQTGFTDRYGNPEMAYVQLHDPVELSSTADGDFVAALPQTETWQEPGVVDAARALRNQSESFLSWVYRDAAIYVGKRQAELQLSDVEELDEDGRVRKAIERLIQLWTPKQERVDKYLASVRHALGRAYDKTASAHLSRLQSPARVSQRDDVAAQWLDERGAQLVTGVMQTTRDELASFMADRVREGLTTKDIANEIRSHFASFPLERAMVISRTEIGEVYNFSTVTTGLAAGIKKGQLVDGKDDECSTRNGKIVNISDALKERLNHPQCTLYIRLLPNAPDTFEIQRAVLDGVHLARYDEEAHVVLLSSDITLEQETEFLLSLGRSFS